MKTEVIIDGKKCELYTGSKSSPFPTKIPVTVIDKGKKSSWLWGDEYFIVVKFNDGEIKKYSTNMLNYYKADIGKEGSVDMYQHSDKLWYPYQEPEK